MRPTKMNSIERRLWNISKKFGLPGDSVEFKPGPNSEDPECRVVFDEIETTKGNVRIRAKLQRQASRPFLHIEDVRETIFELDPDEHFLKEYEEEERGE